jgi:plastocyanin
MASKPKGFLMRKLLLCIPAAFAVLAIAPALSATKGVDITVAGFTPSRTTINYGDTVTWTNKDTGNHQVLPDQGAFPTSPVLTPNQTYSYTFTKSGTFGYRDAFNTRRRGTVVVRPGLSIASTPALVNYGGASTVSGSISSGASGETVTLDAMACGKTTFARVASVRTAANGAWSTPAKPALNTVYQATWRNNKSAQVTAKVAPAVVLKRLRAKHFSARVTAAQSFVGKYVVLQRFATKRHAWVTVKRVVLRNVKAGTPPTMVSSAGFRTGVARRTRLRLVLTQAQAGACYAPARSARVRA